jgi:hypothetical protein
MSHRRQPKMPSRSGSTISPSSFTRSIPFRFAKEIWTRMQRNSLSVGQESCLRISRSGSSCICRRHKRQFPKLMRSLRRSLGTLVIVPGSSCLISRSSFASAADDGHWPHGTFLLSRHRPNSGHHPRVEYHWPCHLVELAYFQMGRELEANRDISLRLVADRSTAQSVSTTCRGAGGVKAV